MTNREWLLNKMQNMSDEEFAQEYIDFIKNKTHVCKDKEKTCDNFSYCDDCVANWLKLEHKEKITLSEAERIILENIDKEYKWIARDKNNYLFVFENKPTKDKDKSSWQSNGLDLYEDIFVFNHLFQFITWNDEQPYNIEELLKNENRN